MPRNLHHRLPNHGIPTYHAPVSPDLHMLRKANDVARGVQRRGVKNVEGMGPQMNTVDARDASPAASATYGFGLR